MQTTSFEQIKAILHSIGKALKNGLAGVRTLAVNAQKTADEAKEKASTVDGKMDANNPVGTGSFSMGRLEGSKVGENSHTEGLWNEASAQNAHAEGLQTVASGNRSHAEGSSTKAQGDNAHAEGYGTVAFGTSSHAEGWQSSASGRYSHAEGYSTLAKSEYQHVQGRLNIADASGRYAHIVGNGEENGTDTPDRSNAHTLDWDGNAWYAGSVECAGVLLTSPNSTKYKLTVADDGTLTATAV